MKILFRADGDSKVGLGHLYRLFALVEMLRNDYDFVFVTREGTLKNIIPDNYLTQYIPMHVQLHEEPQWIGNRFASEEYLIIADGYQFGSEYQRLIKAQNYVLMYIDDLTSEHMYADFVINHSPHVRVDDFKAELYTRFALGLKYALLRPLFIQAATEKKRLPNDIDTAFVCFGGSDQFDFTLMTVQSLLMLEQVKAINIIVGAGYLHTAIYELARENSQVKIFKNLSEIELIQIMKACQLGIAPTSTILFELCSIKMILLAGYYADNQEKAYFELERMNLIHGAGDFRKSSIESLYRSLMLAITSDNENLLQNQNQFFDGLQKKRFLKILNSIENGYKTDAIK